MYKYKKTIIINNRNRRIFSKENSNNEYILYKNNYITLNAYNKKTGGSFFTSLTSTISNPKNSFQRFTKGEQTEFTFPSGIKFYETEQTHNRSKYINIYDYNISNYISNYLKSQSLIKDSNNLKWIITHHEYAKNTTVRGFANEELNKFIKTLNSIETLTEYGNTEHNSKISEIQSLDGYNKTTLATIDKNKLYYYPFVNDYGINNYNVLKNNYYIYYIIKINLLSQITENTDIYNKDTRITYTINNNYDLFNNKMLFKCDNIIKGQFHRPMGHYDGSYDYYVIFSYVNHEINGGKRKYKKR
jgi:hypothetical protein